MPEIIWLGAAFTAGVTAKAIRLPALVGYLVAGMILAAGGVTATATLLTVADLGVTFLLFTLGLHLNLRSLLQLEVLGTAALHQLLSTLLFGGVLTLIGYPLPAAFLVGAGLGFSSTVLTAKSLEANGDLDAYHGRTAIGILIFQDIVAIGLLAFTGAEVPNFYALVLPALVLVRPLLLRLLKLSGRDELLLIFGLLLAFGIGQLFALAGVSAKLGALAAGVLLAGSDEADELYHRLWDMKELFLVGFFLQIGLSAVLSVPVLLTVGLLLLFLPLKGFLFHLLLTRFNLRSRTAFTAALNLTAYSEFALIVGTAAVAGGAIPPEALTMLALLVAVSYVANAPLAGNVHALWRRMEPWLIRFERPVPHPDHPPVGVGHSNVLVAGMGRAGAAAYDFLIEQQKRPLGLDSDPIRVEEHLAHGRRVLLGDIDDPELWMELDLEHVEAIILTVPTLSAKCYAAETLRGLGYSGYIGALARFSGAEEPLRAAGINTVALPLPEAGRELAQVSLQR